MWCTLGREAREQDNLLEFILRTSPSSYRGFITYSYSVARGKVALSAYKRLVTECFCVSRIRAIRYHSISFCHREIDFLFPLLPMLTISDSSRNNTEKSTLFRDNSEIELLEINIFLLSKRKVHKDLENNIERFIYFNVTCRVYRNLFIWKNYIIKKLIMMFVFLYIFITFICLEFVIFLFSSSF